ncbi:hypothetical protein RGQ13_05495 [Thalassotalea psychrophila]|uniref:Uncharacterized protein n=1 Tax=Thalassotalea psychrophila TaxID=3065647 RepID=A0ABY9TY38_9GAMM|nr:hypothetical protein RGQ13_05495 [Colwelliaceae bacterium SQ149]
MLKINFPMSLLETWMELVNNTNFPDVQKTVLHNITSVFGSVNAAELFLEQQKLK